MIGRTLIAVAKTAAAVVQVVADDGRQDVVLIISTLPTLLVGDGGACDRGDGGPPQSLLAYHRCRKNVLLRERPE